MKDPFNKAFIFVKETFLPSTTIVEIVDSRDTTIRHGVCRRKLCAKTETDMYIMYFVSQVIKCIKVSVLGRVFNGLGTKELYSISNIS